MLYNVIYLVSRRERERERRTEKYCFIVQHARGPFSSFPMLYNVIYLVSRREREREREGRKSTALLFNILEGPSVVSPCCTMSYTWYQDEREREREREGRKSTALLFNILEGPSVVSPCCTMSYTWYQDERERERRTEKYCFIVQHARGPFSSFPMLYNIIYLVSNERERRTEKYCFIVQHARGPFSSFPMLYNVIYLVSRREREREGRKSTALLFNMLEGPSVVSPCCTISYTWYQDEREREKDGKILLYCSTS